MLKGTDFSELMTVIYCVIILLGCSLKYHEMSIRDLYDISLLFLCCSREYGAIDDVDIDLHIDVSFLDVSISCLHVQHTVLMSRYSLNC